MRKRVLPPPEYNTWHGMKQRCYNPNNTAYARYGGRGITICDAWRNSFKAFLADMGPKPSPKHSIDRIDNDGNYDPDNCRWATPKEQARHHVGKPITLGGVTKTAAEWAAHCGIHPQTIYQRKVRGWTESEAITTPPQLIITNPGRHMVPAPRHYVFNVQHGARGMYPLYCKCQACKMAYLDRYDAKKGDDRSGGVA